MASNPKSWLLALCLTYHLLPWQLFRNISESLVYSDSESESKVSFHRPTGLAETCKGHSVHSLAPRPDHIESVCSVRGISCFQTSLETDPTQLSLSPLPAQWFWTVVMNGWDGCILGQALSPAYLSRTPGEGTQGDPESCVRLPSHTQLFPWGFSTAFCLSSKVRGGSHLQGTECWCLTYYCISAQKPWERICLFNLEKRTLNSTCLFSI